LILAWGSPPAPAESRADETFPAYGLTIQSPPLENVEVTRQAGDPQDRKDEFEALRKCLWTGTLGESEVRIGLYVYEELGPHINEPGDVGSWAVAELRQRTGAFGALEVSYQAGVFGYAPFISIIRAAIREPGQAEPVGSQYVVSGLLENAGYVLHARCQPSLEEAGDRALMKFFERGIAYDGPERDPDWTLDEVRERWLRDAPEDTHKKFVRSLTKPAWAKKVLIRTKHYLILTNSSGGKLFAKKMEENYKKISEIYPFEKVDGRRLMPVFLFRTPDQYYDFYAEIANRSREAARKSKGHAWRDYYATWYEAPADPVHIHECTHQIFRNRLHLSGAGSWFQEGVAEYIETSDNERNIAARLVKQGRHTPLAEFIELRSLLYSSEDDVKGGSAAGVHYKQAALLIEFLRESKFGKDHFQEFLHAAGQVPRNDVAGIEAAFRRVYGVGVDEVDAQWQKYCKRR